MDGDLTAELSSGSLSPLRNAISRHHCIAAKVSLKGGFVTRYMRTSLAERICYMYA